MIPHRVANKVQIREGVARLSQRPGTNPGAVFPGYSATLAGQLMSTAPVAQQLYLLFLGVGASISVMARLILCAHR